MSTGEQQPTIVSLDDQVLEKMVLAVEKVRQRLKRAATALESAGIAYAVVGGNAVAAWVSKVDPGAARNTVDVDLLINRSDFDSVKTALEGAGFIYRHAKSIDMFLDGPEGRARDAVHIIYAGEKVRDSYAEAAPSIEDAEKVEAYRLLNLRPLVRMKLTSFRDKDRTHIRDLIEVGLLDASWVDGLPSELAVRLQSLLDDPEG